jgi:signal transduction histidine kinase
VEVSDRDEDLTLPWVQRLARRRYTSAQLVAIDAIAVTVVALVFGLSMPSHQPRVSGAWLDLVRCLAYGVAPFSVLFRRRSPRLALVAVLAIALLVLALRVTAPTTFYVVLVLYSVVVVCTRRTAAIVAAVTTAALLTATIVGGSDQVVPAAIGSVALGVLAWLAGENIRASREYAAQRADRAAEKEAESEAASAAQLHRALVDERTDIARELHDIVAHAMSVIAVRSGVARMVIDTQPEQAREALEIIETTTRRSLQEMRMLVGVLRNPEETPADLSPAPGLANLHQLVADIELVGVAVDVDVQGPVRALAPALDLSAYRIVQEALTNVVRHAGPTHASVVLTYRPDAVIIDVTDDGSHEQTRNAVRATSSGAGHGLVGMRERAALFGGTVVAGTCAAGFQVTATLRTDGLNELDLVSSDVAQ